MRNETTPTRRRDAIPRATVLQQGFSLIEMMVILSVLMLGASMVGPAIGNLADRTRLESSARETASLVQRARIEAVRRSAPAVVEFLVDQRRVVAFVDLHGGAAGEPSDGIYNPIEGAPPGTTDFELGRLDLPVGVSLVGPPPGKGGKGKGPPKADGAVQGFTMVSGKQILIVNPDGSAADSGAYRFGDDRGNHLEVRIEPAATARTQVRKYNSGLPANDDGTHWYGPGEGGAPWMWY